MENTKPVSKTVFVVSWVLSILPALFLIFSGVMKFVKPPGIEESLKPIGWDVSHLTGLGIVELACTTLYLIPKTSVLGAILLAAYLGGATATHVRVGDPWFFPVILGILIWLGLWLREPRLKALLPLRG